MNTHKIYDAGIKFLDEHKNDYDIIEKSLHGTFDVSCLGYDWHEDNAANGTIRGQEHEISETEMGGKWPAMAQWIDSHLPWAINSPRLSTQQKINMIVADPWQEWPLMKQIPDLPDDIILKYAPDYDLPEKFKPYYKMTDDEILNAIPELKGLSGNRTKTGITAIRNLRIPAPGLSEIHVIEKKTWKAAKNEIKIGQTNGSGGFCKYAVFIKW